MCDCIPTPSDVSIGGGSNFKVGGGGGGGGVQYKTSTYVQ